MLYDIGFYLYKTPRGGAVSPVILTLMKRLRVCHTRAL